MSGNTIGRSFCVTTFGESHGPAIGAIVDGCPPGLELVGSGHPGRPRAAAHGHVAAHEPAPGTGPGADPVGRVRRAARRAPRSASSSTTWMPARATTRRSRTASVRATPTTRTSRNTGSATIAAAGAPRRASRSRRSRPARSRASSCANGSASRSPDTCRRSARTASNAWMPARRARNPFFCADPDKLPLLEDYIRQLRRDGDSVGRARDRAREPRAAGPRRADVRPARCRHRLSR